MGENGRRHAILKVPSGLRKRLLFLLAKCSYISSCLEEKRRFIRLYFPSKFEK
jgi:hypothetical protein